MSKWWHYLIFWDQLLTTLTIGELKMDFIVIRKSYPLTAYFDSDEAKTKFFKEILLSILVFLQ